ncbi:transcription termination factor MTERF8, chloroplastic [Impatiens glandulifera]|uniref:transcription termination factor MTERF8, chloroplastic n=1 Tax=Impatiens glandulifera TaxID=253017 RepID=UPI001FB0A341|nr:transcription termination factor MTERF8, chloroplastic [Impatiens glandulifera]
MLTMTILNTLSSPSPSSTAATSSSSQSQLPRPSATFLSTTTSATPLSREPRNKNKLFSSILPLLRCSSSSFSFGSTNPFPSFNAETDTILLSLLQAIGFVEGEIEQLICSNPALNIIPFDSIRSRVISLQQLGIDGLLLSRLISKRPHILTAEEIDSVIHFIRRVDLERRIDPTQIERLLYTTEPRLLVGFEEKVKLLLQHGIPKEKLIHVLNNANLSKAFCLKSSEEIERTIIYLNRYGGADLVVHRPSVLNYDLESQLVPRIGFLTKLSGGDNTATSIVLHKLPAILAYTDNHLKEHVDFLMSFAGLSEEEVFRIVLIYPNVFSASRKRKLHPRIDFLKQCGLNSNEIYKFLIKAPLFLSLSFEDNISFKLVFLLKIGYESKTKELAMALGAVTRTSCKNLQGTIGVFLNSGLSCDDILSMSKKHPQVLQYNHESLEEKIDYLLEDMGREVRELLAFPAFLGYKLESRIKHRYEVKRETLGEGMSLNKLLSESAERFSMKEDKKKKRTITKTATAL